MVRGPLGRTRCCRAAAFATSVARLASALERLGNQEMDALVQLPRPERFDHVVKRVVDSESVSLPLR